MTEKKANAHRQPKAWGRYLLVFFLAAWMFVLGVLVGRGSAPVTFDIRALEKELLLLRNQAMHEEREQMKEALGGEVEFYERLPSDAPESTDAIPPLPQPPTVDRADSPPTDTTTQAPPHKTRATLMAKKNKTAVVKPVVAVKSAAAAKPASAVPVIAVPPPPAESRPAPAPPAKAGHLTIQVSALKDGATAEQIVANLKRDGYPAYLSRIVIPKKGLWFRVRVGSYQTREQAAADMTRLEQSRKNPILVEK